MDNKPMVVVKDLGIRFNLAAWVWRGNRYGCFICLRHQMPICHNITVL